MVVRITSGKIADTSTIRVEGRLEKANVAELLAECSSAKRPLTFDLSGLLAADQAGIQALRSLRAEGAEIQGASAYIQHLLEEVKS